MMALEEALLDILVCPIDKGELLYFPSEAALYNPRLRRLYRIEEGIPVMLPGKSAPASDEEHERLTQATNTR
ncbi:MAG: Trm112 family protein [Streptosporangiaceae bacterium]|nr:Trm112 family protein [Streptosporangiaceae bacterium]